MMDSDTKLIRRIVTAGAPAPAGHYSQAVVHAGIVYVAGQVALDPKTGEKRLGSIEEQTEQALRNVGAILRAAGSDFGRVLKMTIYISEPHFWGPVNATFARIMGEHRPARAVIPIKQLEGGYQVEIDAVAALSY
ncbi:MAG TPA: Rid family detoxifying hydrolase [Polyangia bacterium]|jgi:2-iminobutanoate/2-iminopropanoate deaminase|nr:Rid family detoxifying hydrolase [Polyangia bacterium]